MKNLPDIFMCHPIVYAVGTSYTVTVPVHSFCYMWIKVGDKEYYDEANGTLCHSRLVHKIIVPMEELDAAKSYTLFWRAFPVEPESPDVASCSFNFRPIAPDAEKINVYQIADSHGYVDEAVAAGRYYESIGEELDLVIMNGDIFSTSNKVDNFALSHKIAGEISLGEVPVVYVRGNHDSVGSAAENYPEYMPNVEGRTYYTFRLGPIWGVCLDCSEDKPDKPIECGFPAVNAAHREAETLWLESLGTEENPEYLREGIKYRLVVCHIPFARERADDEQREHYSRWCKALKDSIKPNLMMCGHVHQCFVLMPGDEIDALGQPCPAIIASLLEESPEAVHYAGCALTLCGDTAKARYTDELHGVRGEDTVKLSF